MGESPRIVRDKGNETGDVSPLGVGAPPAALLPLGTEIFASTLGKAQDYAALLATEGIARGLIGSRETERLWDRHLLNCAFVGELVPERGELVDIGSGAGLPGVVLALLKPSLHVVLVESMLRRCVFLQECVEQLGLANVRVVRGRAEDLAGSIQADVATARAVAPLGKLAGWAAGLLRPGGEILAIKGQSAEEELVAARPVLSGLSARSAEVLQVGRGRVVTAATVVRVVIGGRGREEQADARRSRPGVA